MGVPEGLGVKEGELATYRMVNIILFLWPHFRAVKTKYQNRNIDTIGPKRRAQSQRARVWSSGWIESRGVAVKCREKFASIVEFMSSTKAASMLAGMCSGRWSLNLSPLTVHLRVASCHVYPDEVSKANISSNDEIYVPLSQSELTKLGLQLLKEAGERGNMKLVQQLLTKRGIDVNFSDKVKHFTKPNVTTSFVNNYGMLLSN